MDFEWLIILIVGARRKLTKGRSEPMTWGQVTIAILLVILAWILFGVGIYFATILALS